MGSSRSNHGWQGGATFDLSSPLVKRRFYDAPEHQHISCDMSCCQEKTLMRKKKKNSKASKQFDVLRHVSICRNYYTTVVYVTAILSKNKLQYVFVFCGYLLKRFSYRCCLKTKKKIKTAVCCCGFVLSRRHNLFANFQ